MPMYNLDEAAERINKEAGLTHTPFEVTPRMLCDWGRIYDGYAVSIQLAFRGNVLNSSKGEITIPYGNYFDVPPDLLFEFEMTDSVNITRLFDGADVLFIEPPMVETMDSLRIAAKDVTDFVTAFKAVLADSQKQQAMAQALRNYAPTAKVEAVTVTQPAPAVPPDDTGLSKRERQIRAMEAEAELLGYKKLEIVTGCKTALRKACKEKHPSLFGGGDYPFNDAWNEAINSAPPRLRMADHQKFAGR